MGNFCTFIGFSSKHVLRVVFTDATEACNNSGNFINSEVEFLVATLALVDSSGSSNSYTATEHFRTQPLDTGSVSEWLLECPSLF